MTRDVGKEVFQLMSDREAGEKIYAGLEMGAAASAVVLVSSDGRTILKKDCFIGASGFQGALEFLGSEARELGVLAGCGVVFPEELSSDASGVLADLFKLTGSKPLTDNVAAAGALGEMVFGAGRDVGSFYYVSLGGAVGGSLVVDGKVWRGCSGLAGRLGSVVIGADGKTVDDFASDESILRRTRNRFHQDHTSSLVSMDESEIAVSDIVREAQNGDEFAVMMLELLLNTTEPTLKKIAYTAPTPVPQTTSA